MIKSLGIKDKSAYYWNNIIYLETFDNRMLKITKRENRKNNNMYYISYTKVNQYVILIIYILLFKICMVQ